MLSQFFGVFQPEVGREIMFWPLNSRRMGLFLAREGLSDKLLASRVQ